MRHEKKGAQQNNKVGIREGRKELDLVVVEFLTRRSGLFADGSQGDRGGKTGGIAGGTEERSGVIPSKTLLRGDGEVISRSGGQVIGWEKKTIPGGEGRGHYDMPPKKKNSLRTDSES